MSTDYLYLSPLGSCNSPFDVSADEDVCNALDPRLAVDFGNASHELREQTQALPCMQQLRADHEAAAALCPKLGMRSCKELREAKAIVWSLSSNSRQYYPIMHTDQPYYRTVSPTTQADLALMGRLGSVLPALEEFELRFDNHEDDVTIKGPEGVLRLVEGLGAGALPAVRTLRLERVEDAGAEALAAALGRGALVRLEILDLGACSVGDVGLVALAPALRRLAALKELNLFGNTFGDDGLTALFAPPPPAGALSSPTGGLAKLKSLNLSDALITDAGCAVLASALDRGTLPGIKNGGSIWLESVHNTNATYEGFFFGLQRGGEIW